MIGNRTRLMLVIGPLSLICAPLALGGCIDRSATGAGARGAIEIATLPGVTFQTVLGGMYVGAENNGGGAVNATASSAQASSTFTLLDINGGSLKSGDSVFIRAGNGQYLQALNGGGSTLNAATNNQLAWETFKVVRRAGDGAVNNGDVVGLQCFSGAWISAESGGSGPVFAYGGALGAWEQFEIAGLSATDVPPPTPAPPVPPGSSTTVRDVNFRTALGGRYVGAVNNGGGAVTATANAAQEWETFALIDVNGGSLASGDSVFVQTGNGAYFQAVGGGGSTLNAGGNNQLAAETFKIVKENGSGAIQSGDTVGLQASSGSWVSAENGGGGSVFAYGGALGPWERLIISIGGAGPGGAGGSPGTGGPDATGCDSPNLVWKTGNKTNYTSYPDPGSDECIRFSGCLYEGLFAACSGKKSKAWVMSHNVVAAFPNFTSLNLHDLCVRSGNKTMVVTVYDTCGDNDCSGCCTQNRGNADALIDMESFTNARWGLPDGRIQWADLGPTTGGGCE